MASDTKKVDWNLGKSTYASEEDVARARVKIIDAAREAVDGLDKNAVFVALVRIAGEIL